jgi:YVTN family beta-propeller protein
VNFAQNANGQFAYVTVGGLNQVQVYNTGDFSRVATIPVGKLPHGIWPSGDGSRIYVGLENDDGLTAIDTLTNRVIATIPIGQAPQALVYVPNAVPTGEGLQGLQDLGIAGKITRLALAFTASGLPPNAEPPTSVALFDQGLTQILQAAVTGLVPMKPYVLALSVRPDGGGALQPLASFTSNPAGAAVVVAVGAIRQVVSADAGSRRRYLVVAPGTPDQLSPPVQREL